MERIHETDKIFPSNNEGSYPFKMSELPHFTLPDGAHNFDSETFTFILPSIEDSNQIFFCLVIYRQIKASEYKLLSDEDTRNSIQRSYLVIMRVLFEEILSSETVAELNERFELSYGKLNESINETLNCPKLYNLSLNNESNILDLIITYQRDVLVIFKAILLERRILFNGDSAGLITNWILSLLNLFPSLLECGIQSNSYNLPWMKDKLCWPLLKRYKPEDEPNSTLSDNATDLNEYSGNSSKVENQSLRSHSSLNSLMNQFSNIGSSQKNDKVLKNEGFISTQQLCNIILKSSQPSIVEEETCNPFLTDVTGFPLAIFSKQYKLLPYLPLTRFSDIIDEEKILINTSEQVINSVKSSEEECQVDEENSRIIKNIITEHYLVDKKLRGFIAGATNPLFAQKRDLYDIQVVSLPSAFKTALSREVYDVLAESEKELNQRTNLNNQINSPSQFLMRKSAFVKFPEMAKTNLIHQSIEEEYSSETNTLTLRHFYRNSRRTCENLSKILELSRMDRIFIDHIIMVCNSWMRINVTHKPNNPIISQQNNEEINNIQITDQMDEKIKKKFPDQESLENWIRKNFESYLLSLLLNAYQCENTTPSDFNVSFINAFQETRCFQIWKKNISITNLMQEYKPDPQLKTSENNEPSLTNHPGCEYQKELLSYQVFENIKQLSNTAADQGRELVRKSLSNFLKFGSEAQNSPFVEDLTTNFIKSVKAVKSLTMGDFETNNSIPNQHLPSPPAVPPRLQKHNC